jgi:hypothetical protein
MQGGNPKLLVSRLHLEKTKMSVKRQEKTYKGPHKPRRYREHTATTVHSNNQAKPGKHPNGYSQSSQKTYEGPGAYREALTTVRIAILKENYPEDTVYEEDQELILSETMGVFQRTSKEGLPQLRLYRLEGVCPHEHLC